MLKAMRNSVELSIEQVQFNLVIEQIPWWSICEGSISGTGALACSLRPQREMLCWMSGSFQIHQSPWRNENWTKLLNFDTFTAMFMPTKVPLINAHSRPSNYIHILIMNATRFYCGLSNHHWYLIINTNRSQDTVHMVFRSISSVAVHWN